MSLYGDKTSNLPLRYPVAIAWQSWPLLLLPWKLGETIFTYNFNHSCICWRSGKVGFQCDYAITGCSLLIALLATDKSEIIFWWISIYVLCRNLMEHIDKCDHGLTCMWSSDMHLLLLQRFSLDVYDLTRWRGNDFFSCFKEIFILTFSPLIFSA